MTFTSGDLNYEILARGHGGHGHSYHSSTGGAYGHSSPETDWWIYPVIIIGFLVFVVVLAKKIQSNAKKGR